MRTSGDGGFGEGKGDEGVFRVDDGRTYDLVPLIRKGNMEMSRGGRWKWEVSYLMPPEPGALSSSCNKNKLSTFAIVYAIFIKT